MSIEQTSRISVILFDMGRVLVEIDFEAFPNALGLHTPEQRAPYRDAAMKNEYLYECGKISTEEFLRNLVSIFENRFTTEQLLDAYDRIIVKENTPIVSLVREVQQRRRIALLSNTSETHWKRSLEIAPLLGLFTDRFTSFQIGAMKPSPVTYQYVIKALGVEPSSILFIDDVQENIDGALSCGMQGIVYTDVPSLQKELHRITG